MLQALQIQQQIFQQNGLIQAVVSALTLKGSFSAEVAKPKPFDGFSGYHESWTISYEYACNKTAEIQMKECRICCRFCVAFQRNGTSWASWDINVTHGAQRKITSRHSVGLLLNEVRKLRYRYRSGAVLEYFFEKRRLLQHAEPCLL
ncbi:hypothetical protein HPB50_021712 [Hyalomma asiaticum]|uniref:Uncharacterized protein n=1 Tax=Hyalomma asiaticum TaxID=266040 RepID=A0ACB7T9W1_HYAAI|nr:hypothetical protein HPB50_021712 [Hyalomma asiaticum]